MRFIFDHIHDLLNYNKYKTHYNKCNEGNP